MTQPARYASVFRPGLFAGQLIWVTGGSGSGSGSGIGRCAAHGLASQGAAVLISGRTQAKLDAVQAEITADCGEHHETASGGGHPDAARADLASVASFDLTLRCQGQLRTQRVPDTAVRVLAWQGQQARLLIDGVQRSVIALQHGTTLHLSLDGAVFRFEEPSAQPRAAVAADATRARAPVAGVVARVNVQVGDSVEAGQPLVCVEAMKMEMWLNAAAAGTVLVELELAE